MSRIYQQTNFMKKVAREFIQFFDFAEHINIIDKGQLHSYYVSTNLHFRDHFKILGKKHIYL